jgi:hypothetical protein
MGGIQGFPARASRMAVKTAMPCLAAVEAYPRIAYRWRVVSCERSRPEIFCWVFAGRKSRSAWLDVSRDGGVGQEPQHVGFAVAQAFEQRPGRRLLALGAGGAADVG